MSTTERDALTQVCDEIVGRYLVYRGQTTALQAFQDALNCNDLTTEHWKDVPRDLRTLVEQGQSIATAQALARTQLAASSSDELDRLVSATHESGQEHFVVCKTLRHLHHSNLLSIHTVQVPVRKGAHWVLKSGIATTGADKLIVFCDPSTGEVHTFLDRPMKPTPSGAVGHDAAVLDLSQHPQHAHYVVSAGMDGRVVVWDLTFQDHTRFAVRVAHSACGTYLASAGYDRKIVVYRSSVDSGTISYTKVHELHLETNPEALQFVPGPAAPPAPAQECGAPQRAWLVFTVRDCVRLSYMALPAPGLDEANATPDFAVIQYNTNLDPDDPYASYSLLDLSLHPSGQFVCAQTGDHAAMQHMTSAGGDYGGLAQSDTLSRLLILPLFSSFRRLTLWTEAPSSSFAHPRHTWRPEGDAAWVTGQDGVLRLVTLGGEVKACVRAHGLAPDLDTRSDQGRDATAAAAWVRGGNTVIKGVTILHDGRIASCGFDRTVRLLQPASF